MTEKRPGQIKEIKTAQVFPAGQPTNYAPIDNVAIPLLLTSAVA
jgi:hypothetical protein